MSDGPDGGDGAIRVDKWLWHARFLKSRSLAAKLIAAGHLRIDGERSEKPSRTIRPGAVLTFPAGSRVRVVRVVAPGARRGPAPEAQALYEDLSPEPMPPEPRAGPRPTKRERRVLDRAREAGSEAGDTDA